MNKVLYVYQNYGNIYSSAALSILRALRKIEEIEVGDFEIKPVSYSTNISRVANRLPLFSAVHFKRQNNELERIVLKNNYDYVFVMKGTDLKSTTLKHIKQAKPSLKLMCFNPDDPFNKASSNDDIISSIPLYDYYCIWTKHLDAQLKAAGAQHIVYFPFGIDREIIYPVTSSYAYDISFIGNGDAERQKLILGLNQEIVKRDLDIKIHIFGSNWPISGKQMEVHGQRNDNELLETIGATRINLNLLRKQNKNSINMRTFEIPAAHGFMMHEKSDEAESFFLPNDEVVYFDSIEDLMDKCMYYLENEDKRLSVIQKCTDRIKKNDYSYYNFLKTQCHFLFNEKTE